MKRPFIALLLAGAVIPGASAAAPRKASVADVFERASNAYDAGDCATALPLVLPIISAHMAKLGDDEQAIAYDIAVDCSVRAKDREGALRLTLAGTALSQSSDYVWRMRLFLQAANRDNEAALVTIEEMTQGRGRALNSISDRWMNEFYRRIIGGNDVPQKIRLLKILTDNSYLPGEPLSTTDNYRLAYAIILVKAGRGAEVPPLLAAITHSEVLAEVLFDRRLKDLRPADIDLRKATEAELAVRHAAIPANPRSLRVVIYTAQTLRSLGRAQESLDTLKAIETQIDDAAAFDDFDQYRNWWWDGVARSYEALGKFDDAIAAFQKGLVVSEDGAPNVSQTLNLAAMQLKLARYRDALVTASASDDPKFNASPYGQSVLRTIRACTYHHLDQAEKAQGDVDYLAAHEADNPDGLAAALMCRGESDKAAVSVIKRLDDPDGHARALLELSDYDPPVALPPNDLDEMSREILLARPDVQAAIKRAGGTRSIHLQR